MTKDEMLPANPSPELRTYAQPGTRIGASLEFNGDLTGHESVAVEGRLKGTVTIPSGTLTIARGAKVEAEIKVKELILHGNLDGNVTAGDFVQLSETAQLNGDITAARISIVSGARFKGRIKITKT